MGSFYGGDGVTNIALPDFRGRRSIQNVDYFSNLAQRAGANQAVLSTFDLPPHTHSLPFPDSATGSTGGGAQLQTAPTLVFNHMIVVNGAFPASGTATVHEPFLGQVMLFAGNYLLNGASALDGPTLSISANSAFYTVMGTNYGGDGISTFGLPNLVSLAPVGKGHAPINTWALGQKSGPVTISVAQMPSHQHTVPAIGVTTGFTGGGQPINLMGSLLAFQFLISTNGQLPSHSVPATNEMMGEIQLYAGANLPGGWLPCDGRLLQVANAPGLFGVISNFYGGDGLTTFALPNLAGRIVVGSTNGQPGASSGAEQVTLTFSNLPSHTHSAPVPDFDRWITSFGLSGNAAAFTADPDADGAASGYEWATDTNPTNAPSHSFLNLKSANHNAVIGFPRNTNAIDVVFTLQRSTNLANPNAWTGIATNVAGVWSPSNVAAETGVANPVNVSISDPLTNSPNVDYRLQVTWP
jgi:microcystin-dependent protein